MAAGIASTYIARPGGGAELRNLLLDAADYLSGIGEGESQVRVTWLGGDEAGRYSLVTLYPNVAAQMDGFDRVAAVPIGAPSTAWVVEKVEDTNGDGLSDIFWRHSTSGTTVVWQMVSYERVATDSPGGVGDVWQVQ